MSPTKVFVGNLSFKTKEAELADEFSTVGKVLTANIITRGYRSLGYGFVEFEKEEDARNALASLNKKNINGREINVELATPREEGAPRPPRQRGRSGPPRGRGGDRGDRGGDRVDRGEHGESPNVGENRRGNGYSPRGRGGYRGGRNNAPSSPNVDSNSNNNSPYNNRNENNGDQRPPRTRGYRRGFGKPNPQRSSPSPNRTPSVTTLFVANLPYQFTDDELLKLLPNATKAYVAKNFNGRSKGFGFVEFASEDNQKAALAASDKLFASNRELIVKIALTDDRKSAPDASPAQAQ
eukprot:TRINITY_DN11111_c0_g1_i1.p1 TRINITY_DN11111_c0_g1~~TRINITY_DN11111_c0_g1_i1.p1  ORF type:complete len:295 (-),score=67.18 TRINITY_DN11111_c0_g1_i1:54-938(-)